ncbi:T9SS type A sorting domain-containing protein [Pontibacter silvestris]|nr:T9SS type A sorting domain-containing protein [Pontibacter silvestris]MCC9135634.1 T9SS type A sorting domain-containing protein [Pontibacter silvestris]
MFFLSVNFELFAQVCSSPGKDGILNSTSTIVNTYYPGTASVTAGDNVSVSVGPANASGNTTPISQGDLVLIIQMQGADMDVTNTNTYGTLSNNVAGTYEYAMAISQIENGAFTVAHLKNSYIHADYGAQGQKRFQVVRVPQYSTATLMSTITSPAWDGSTGGIVAMDVAGFLNFNNQAIDVSGKGFRGGAGRRLRGGTGGSETDYRTLSTNDANAQKGEGIAGTPAFVNFGGTTPTYTGVEGYVNGSMGRGAPGNAGGGGTDGSPEINDQNSGGGGGANGGAGGQGGNSWNSNPSLPTGKPIGGIGGAPFSTAGTRVVMGGGGGAGSTNDGSGTPGNGFASSGAAGGGIVMVRAGSIAANVGTISANGASGYTAGYDGTGGGGAGGTVLLTAANGLNNVTVNAKGGIGGSNGKGHGPGGGGGGGVIMANAALNASSSVEKGYAGSANSSGAFGAVDGEDGVKNEALSTATLTNSASGSNCLPVLTVTKTTSSANITRATDGTATATYSIKISNTGGAAQGVTVTDVLPAGFSFASHNSIDYSDGVYADNGGDATTGAVSLGPASTFPVNGNTTLNWGTFTLPSGSNVSITFTVNIAKTVGDGTYQNGVTVTYLDPTRKTATRKISPATGGDAYNIAYETGASTTVAGANYIAESSTAENVTITNSAPTASNITFSPAIPNTAAATIISPLTATDSDGTIASFRISVLPTSGTLYINGAPVTSTTDSYTATNGKLNDITYKPDAGFVGEATFNFTATDDRGATVTATYTIPVVSDRAAVYTTPNVFSRYAITVGLVVATAKDADGTITSATVSGSALPGFLTLNTQGAVSVNNNAVEEGVYTTNITTTDSKGGISTVPVTITINSDAFQANSDATKNGENCYTLTLPEEFRQGEVWSVTPIDLTKSFEISFNINLGSNDNGADGVAFGLQQQASNPLFAKGESGQGLGFQNIAPSVGVEFDTYDNGSNDLSADHVGFFLNGKVTEPVTTPVQMSSTSNNTEDGADHAVKIIWVKDLNTLSVYFDGEFRTSYSADIVNEVFSDNPQVYFGFTASTGTLVNQQSVCQIKYNQSPVAINYTNSVALISTAAATAVDALPGSDADGMVASFRFNSLPSAGKLYIDGVVADLITDYAWSSRNLITYDPVTENPDDITFSYSIKDSEGAVDGTPATFTIPINREPEAKDIMYSESDLAEEATEVKLTPLSGVDYDGTLANFRITTLPVTGLLTINAVPAEADKDYSWDQANTLVYKPVANATSDVTFHYTVIDAEGVADASPATYTIPVMVLNSLPVTLVKFTAVEKPGGNVLSWTTATEVDNDHFLIERSTDGKVFMNIGKVKGSGSSNQLLDYSYTDKSSPIGTVYYRLKQVGLNGDYEYSHVVSVTTLKSDGITKAQLYPNPASDIVHLNMDMLPKDNYTVRIISMEGRTIQQKTLNNEVEQELDVHALSTGKYIIQIQGKGTIQTISMIKR